MVKVLFSNMIDEREASGGDSSRDAAFMARVHQAVELAGGIAALSRKCGLSRGVIHKYLNGDSEPSRPRLIALAQAANVDVTWLATGEAGLPDLDDKALLMIVTRHAYRMPNMNEREKLDFIDRTFQRLRPVQGTEPRLIALGAAISAHTQGDDEDGSPITEHEMKLFRARDPLFVLWRWRHGRGESSVTRKKDLTDPDMVEFQQWMSGLRVLSDDEMVRGVWGGDGGRRQYIFKFFLKRRVFRRFDLVTRALVSGSVQTVRGGWDIIDRHVAAVYLDGQQDGYIVGEIKTGRNYAIMYGRDEASYDSILLLDHAGDESAIGIEFRTHLETARAVG